MKSTIKKLTIVYYIIYLAAVVAATLGYYLTVKKGMGIDVQSDTGTIISQILIIYIIGSIPLALGIFHAKTKKWAKLENNDEKIQLYYKGSVLRLLVVGLGLFLGVLFFYILQSQSMIFCAGIAAIGLFFCKPADVKMIAELELDTVE